MSKFLDTEINEADRLRQIAQYTPGVIYQFRMRPDGSFHFPYASDGLLEIHGVYPAEVSEDASKFFSVVHPEDIDRLTQSIFESAANMTPWHCEYRVNLPHKRQLWLLGHSTPQKAADGSTLWHGYLQNITESKTTEVALKVSENKFRSIIENLNDMVYVINSDACFSYISPQFQEFTGYEAAELLDDSFAKLVYPEDLSICVDALQLSLQGENVRGIEYRVLHKDGKYYWHSSNVSALRDEDGEVVSCLGVARYVHEQQAVLLERKQAEKSLQETNNLLKSVLETMPDFFFAKDLEGKHIAVNSNLARFFGKSVTDIIGKTDAELLPPDIAENIMAKDQEIMTKGVTARFEEVVPTDGFPNTYLTTKTPLLDDQGNIAGLIGVAQNITDRKAAEQELEQFFNVALDLLCIADFSGHFRRLNRAWETILGYNIQELEGQLFLDFVHPDDIAATLEVMSEVSEQKPVLQFTNRYRAKDGSYRYIEWRSVPSGDLIYAAARDVTDRKQAELENQQVQNFLSSIIENIPNMVFVKDAENLQFLRFNKAGEELLGYPREALLGKSDYDFFPPEEAAFFVAKDREVLGGGTVIEIPEELIQTNHQGTRILHTRKIPILNELGHPKYLLGISEDITDRKAAEAALSEYADRQTLLNQLIHQIRNSLDLDLVIATTIRSIREFLDIDACNFAWYIPNAESPIWEVIQEAKLEEIPSGLGSYPSTFVGPIDQLILNQEILHVDDSTKYEEPIHRAFLDTIHCQSEILLPIQTHSHRLGIIICAHYRQSRPWLDSEIELLKAVTDQLTIAINQAELYAESRSKSQELQNTLQELQHTQTQMIQSEKMSSLGQLVGGIAHEVNNPVSFIYGNIQPARNYVKELVDLVHLYQEQYPDPTQIISKHLEEIDLEYLVSDFANLLTSMENGATRIRDIVKSLRTFSRLDEEGCKAIDIHENIDSTLMVLQSRFNGRDGKPEILLIRDYGNLPWVECYGGLLNQVFINLLMNAIDSIMARTANEAILLRNANAIEQQPNSLEPNSLEPKQKSKYYGVITITTSLTPTNQAIISIQDNGCGMDAQVQEKIFNPFFTTKPVGQGTGMGLAVSYQIMTENHQGNILVTSAPGEGTEFIITMPIKQNPELKIINK